MKSIELSAVWGIQVEDVHLNKTRMIIKTRPRGGGDWTAVSSQDTNSKHNSRPGNHW